MTTRPDHVRHLFRELAVAIRLTELSRERDAYAFESPEWNLFTRVMTDVCLLHVPLFRLFRRP